MNNVRIPGFEQADLEKLVAKGYDPITAIVFARDGLTRDVYEICFRSDDLTIKRAMKVPKRDIGETSITTLINYVNNGVNENEVRCLQELNHPNIARIVDTMRREDGSIVNFEELVEGVSLKNYVSNHSTFDKKKMRIIFSKVIDGLTYMNETMNYLHRDVKPSNILYNPMTGEVKISDLENAKKVDEIESKNLATRGGTTYTHPELLNAILGKPNKASFKTDVYALVNTMYYALTGQDAFDYKIDYDLEGKQICVGDKHIRVALYSNENKMEKITSKTHEGNKKNAIKKLPRAWRAFFKKGLSFDGYQTMSELNKSFNDALKNVDRWDKLKKSLPTAAAAGIAITAFAILGANKLQDYNVVDSGELSNKTWKSECFDRNSSSGNYYEIFKKAYDNVKIEIVEGRDLSRFNIGDSFVSEVAEKYGLNEHVLKNMSRCIKVAANEFGGNWVHGFKTPDVLILDPFIADAIKEKRVTNLKDNWRKGAERLSGLLELNKGDYEKALYDFYNPVSVIDNGSYVKHEWVSGSSLDERYLSQIDDDVKMIIHNILHTGMGYEVYDGGRSISLKDPKITPKIYYSVLDKND